MKTKILLSILIFAVLLVQAALAESVIVGFHGKMDENLVTSYGIENYSRHGMINAISADISPDTIVSLKKHPKVRYVEKDAVVKIQKKSPEPPQQIGWGVCRVNAPAAWSSSTGTNVKIAVLDTGIDKKHPDLDVNGGVNLIGTNKNSNWMDDHGHGTHVAGIIAARDNSIGVVGVAPDTELYAVKVIDASGYGRISDVIDGIEWAVQNDIDIVSMSLGTSTYSQAFEDATMNANAAGVLLVAATGNCGDGDATTDEVIYPAKFDAVIAVSATDETNITPAWSASGPEVELAAPGVNIYSTCLDGGYTIGSGTSMATPFVSGIAALVKSKNLALSPDEIRGLMHTRAIDFGMAGRDNVYGFGLVQAGMSL